MYGRLNLMDAQQNALSFLVAQSTIIEPQVYRLQYPDIQYQQLIPVVTEGDEWARSITFFSQDQAGKADWFDHQALDMPMADISREMFETGVQMAGIGYHYTLQELAIAARVPNANLPTDRAAAARRAYEEMVDDIALRGSATKNWTGLINDAGVTVVTVAADGTGSSRLWSTKTETQILRDVNSALTGMWTATSQLEIADTLLLSIDRLQFLAEYRMANIDRTLLSWIKENNVFTQQAGTQLMIRAVRGLETAGASGVQRMVAYRRDPQVVKLHLPMPHKFMPVWQRSPLRFDVPGIFRLGGVEIRRPGAVRYVDGF